MYDAPNKLPIYLLAMFFVSCCLADELGQSFENRLLGFVGNEPVQCGAYTFEIDRPRYLPTEETSKISNCMTMAYHSKRAFYFSLEGPDFKSNVIYGVLGLPENRGIYRYHYSSRACKGRLCNDSFTLSRCHGDYFTDIIDAKETCHLSLEQPLQPLIGVNQNKQSRCEFPKHILPENFTVFSAGVFSSRKLGLRIDKQSGYEGNQIDMLVNYPKTPVILLLGAYYPTIWNINWSEHTQIIGIVVGGFHRQVVAGLPANIPIVDSCGHIPSRDNEEELKELNPLSRRLFGRSVNMVYLAKDGKVLIGNEPVEGTKILTSPETPPESFYDNNALPAGQAGLDLAIQRGLIRKTTQSDIDAWQAKEREITPKIELPPVAGKNTPEPVIRLDVDSYVILKPFELPSGLPSLSKFFVPVDVPMPTGQRQHVIVYDLNTGKCNGPIC